MILGRRVLNLVGEGRWDLERVLRSGILVMWGRGWELFIGRRKGVGSKLGFWVEGIVCVKIWRLEKVWMSRVCRGRVFREDVIRFSGGSL